MPPNPTPTRQSRAERQRAIRAKIRGESFVRKVWLLSHDMADRIVNFQEDQLLPSEVEAARRLLDIGLRERGL